MRAEAEIHKPKSKIELKTENEKLVKEEAADLAPSTVPSTNEEPEEERCSSALSRGKTPSEKEVEMPYSKTADCRFNEELSEIISKEVENSPQFAAEIITNMKR